MANGNGLNGYVAVPRWVLGLALVVLAWGITVEVRLSVTESNRFTNLDGQSMRQELLDSIRGRVGRYHGGAP